MELRDPDTDIINESCIKLIDAKIKIHYTIEYGETVESGDIDDCNIVGNCMETILYPYLKDKIPTLEKGPLQKSPDFYNRNKQYDWELKTFCKSPNFDIANYTSYITQLSENLNKKLYKTQYLVFKYEIKNDYIIIKDFVLCNVWNIVSYDKTYPISLQNKKGTWYNIRPCCFKDMKKNKTAKKFINNLIKSINECPNNIENKESIINKINDQYNTDVDTLTHLIEDVKI